MRARLSGDSVVLIMEAMQVEVPGENKKTSNPMPDVVPGKPVDSYYFVLISMFVFGLVSILPWSFFTTADNYWKFRFRDPSNTSHSEDFKTPLQKTFSSYLIIASKFPLLVFLLINSALSAKLSPGIRIIPSLLLNLIIFVVHCALAFQDFDYEQEKFLGITLGTVGLVNVASAFLQGAFLGFASCFPPMYMGAVTYGQAASSVVAAFVQILTLLAANSPKSSAVIYFACASAILLITIIMFFVVRKTDFYSFHISTQVGRNSNDTSSDVPYCYLYSKLWKHILSTAFVFWVTLSINPPLQVMIVQSNHIIPDLFFIPICVFLLPNLLDLIFRVVAMRFPFNTRNGWLLLLFTTLRFAAIPLTMYCNLQPRKRMPVAFQNDIIFVLLSLLLGMTNGYFQTVAITEPPRLVETKYQETVGSIMAFAIGIGLLLGSLSSFGFTELV